MTRTRRSRVATLTAALAIAASLAVPLTGCRPKKPAPASQQPPPNVTPDEYANMTELERRAKELEAVSRQLPGPNPAEDRRLIAQGFEPAQVFARLRQRGVDVDE